MSSGFYVLIALVSATAGGVIGRVKGSSFWIWFLISLVVPFIGPICALAYRWESDEPRRQCPRCGKVTAVSDALCTRCGTELEYPDVVLPPERRAAAAR